MELRRSEYFPSLLSDRLANSIHVEIIGSLVPLRSARVMELRSRLGSISDALRRLFRADVQIMTLFETQQFVIEEIYRIPTKVPIDYDRFEIPFDGPFDLVVANHMLTHAVRPQEFLATIAGHLAPGGHLYLYNEMNEDEYLVEGKSMFNFNPFHMQAFSRRALLRGLEANGFTTVFMTVHERRPRLPRAARSPRRGPLEADAGRRAETAPDGVAERPRAGRAADARARAVASEGLGPDPQGGGGRRTRAGDARRHGEAPRRETGENGEDGENGITRRNGGTKHSFRKERLRVDGPKRRD
jgi:SAM-dependent methyltransferase